MIDRCWACTRIEGSFLPRKLSVIKTILMWINILRVSSCILLNIILISKFNIYGEIGFVSSLSGLSVPFCTLKPLNHSKVTPFKFIFDGESSQNWTHSIALTFENVSASARVKPFHLKVYMLCPLIEAVDFSVGVFFGRNCFDVQILGSTVIWRSGRHGLSEAIALSDYMHQMKGSQRSGVMYMY